MDDFNWLKDFNAQPMTDDVDFPPIEGGYKAVVTQAGRQQGTAMTGNAYDFHSLNIKILETVDGNPAGGRYISKTYNTQNPTEFTEPIGEKKRLLTDLVTMGIEIPKLDSDEAFDALVQSAQERHCCVRCWKTKSGKQASKIVKEIKPRKKKAEATEAPADF